MSRCDGPGPMSKTSGLVCNRVRKHVRTEPEAEQEVRTSSSGVARVDCGSVSAVARQHTHILNKSCF